VVTLEQTMIFGCLDAAQLAELKERMQEQRFAAGAEIFKEGDAGTGLYVVKEGLVEISAAIGGGRRHAFSRIEPGDIFGEMAVIEEAPRSASAVATMETVAWFISRETMLSLMARSPAFALALSKEISRRLREFDRQYLSEVLQAERLSVVGRFARSIVHDLKNPLNVIGLAAELAAMEKATAEARKEAQSTIRHQVEHISEMIGEILEFTQSSHSEVALAAVDYASFVERLVQELWRETAVKSVSIELENAPPAVPVLMDSKRLGRVFRNLVHNATDAMPEGGRIRFRFSAVPPEVVTEIEDEGPGIPAEIAPRLFEPFATYGKVSGTGLGLCICKRIIEDHKGWIRARTEPGHGAIFTFGLPIPAAAS
jgi:signal transduction histidine kinase